MLRLCYSFVCNSEQWDVYLQFCLSQGCCCCDEPWPKQRGEEQVCSAYTSTAQLIVEGNQDKNPSSGEPRGRSWCRPWGVGCCFLTWSVYFIIKSGTISPGKALSTMGCTLLHQSLVKKIFHRITYSSVLRRYFFSWSSLFSDDSSLCRVDIKVASTSLVGFFFFFTPNADDTSYNKHNDFSTASWQWSRRYMSWALL